MIIWGMPQIFSPVTGGTLSKAAQRSGILALGTLSECWRSGADPPEGFSDGLDFKLQIAIYNLT